MTEPRNENIDEAARDEAIPSLRPDKVDQQEVISVAEPADALVKITLEDLTDPMREACARAGWKGLMPVQAMALPYLIKKRDLMIQSRTGSGKTGTYLLPLIPILQPEKSAPQALILAPTRELALQIEREAQLLFGNGGLKVAALYGGVGYGKQMEALRGGAQVIVGTPGRVLDHLLRRTLSLDALRMLVFDEADRMLSIGFYPDMKEIQRYLPKKSVSACLLSATFPPHVLNLASEFMRDPSMLSLSHSQVHVAEVQHIYCQCKAMDKDRALVRILETENPTSAMIFCNTKANVHFVTAVLRGFGYNVDELSADLSQARREEVLQRVRDGLTRFLVATDVAARGIDIPELSHVILYETPEDRESYIHRAGRTGRAGAAGTVISLVDVMQKMELERIARFYKIELVHRATPSDEDVSKVVAERATALLEARFRGLTSFETERTKRFNSFVSSLVAEEDQVPLLSMLLDEFYQKTLHNVPEQPDYSSRKSRVSEHSAKSSGRRSKHGSGGRSESRRRGETRGRGAAEERGEERSSTSGRGAADKNGESGGGANSRRRGRSGGRRKSSGEEQ